MTKSPEPKQAADALLSVVAQSPGNPYQRFEGIPAADAQSQLLADLRALQPDLIWSRCDRHSWLAITRLPWDSEKLALRVGKAYVFCAADNVSLGVQRLLAVEIRDALQGAPIDYVIARIVETDRSALAVLALAGFAGADFLVNLSRTLMDFPADPESPRAIRIGTADTGDEKALYDLASRYFENRLLSESRLDLSRIRSLYGEWAVNNLRGRAHFTLVARSDERVIGFISCRLDKRPLNRPPVGFVDLIVVESQNQRANVGRSLMGAAACRMLQAGARVVELNVAGNNTRALRFYAGLGFAPKLRYVDLSLWIER